MPFFQVDDQMPSNAKMRRLSSDSIEGDLTGMAAKGLWVEAGAASQAALTDGHLTRADVLRILLNPDLAEVLTERLVSASLWHTRGHDCPRCPQPDEPPYEGCDYVFHDWTALGYSSGQQVKTQRAKAKELKDPALIEAVWARDCIDPAEPGIGRCRYCGTEVKRKTTVGETKPEMDHVDPTIAIGPANVVLSCRACNRKKGRRNPDQAGMTLRPAPRQTPTPTTRHDGRPLEQAEKVRTSLPPARPDVNDQPVEPVRPLEQAEAKHSPLPPARPEDSPVTSDRAGEGGDAGTAVATTLSTNASTTSGTTPGTRRGRPPGRPEVDQAPELSRAHDARVRAPGRVRVGLGEGPGEGQGAGGAGHGGVPPPSTSARRRRRRRSAPESAEAADPGPSPEVRPGGQPRADPRPDPRWHAGEAPVVEVAGQFGSPWHGWRGPRSSVTETTCPDHGLEQPCPRCPAGGEP